ncbi:MAG: DUF192 domain-containing protein [Candidatus Omnitrophica bacterium]|nr:DUF192 domain-containing protein [Candidatus Omnitrophota bacterium]MDD5236776.1 DUF192 domain-containing protein [Candidatus Omnitrophota bacterium]
MAKSAISFFVIIFGLLSVHAKASENSNVCFQNNCFYVETVKTEEARSRGLMFRNNLPIDNGMLFIFEEEGIYPFWMKNMSIPLDILWINTDKELVFISRNTPPCTKEPCPVINPGAKARYVLEINAGLSQKLGLKLGDKLRF